jgi:asparagine synthase (glutamine-hydrolysing)
MCGMIAQVNASSHFRTGLLNHRGPDQDYRFVNGNLELEYFRLSITGGPEGESPVRSKDRRWVVFLNGEIYNFRSLQMSYSLPKTNSDTQVIADGLEKFGVNFFTRLRGMFAGIALDTQTQKIYVYRDSLGEKPLFFTKENGVLSFASEFQALLTVLNREIVLDDEAAASYFRFSYAEEPLSFDKLIRPFPKGHVISFDLLTLEPHTELILPGYSLEDTALPLHELLELVLDEQLSVEVPSGLALSGGVDSNALLVAKSTRSFDSFYPLIVELPSQPGLSEAPAAMASCARLGIEPILLNLQFSNLAPRLTELAALNDQPHADPSGLSYVQIFAKAQALGLKVVYLGHGPDEFFWGYPWLNKQLSEGLGSGLFKTFSKNPKRPFWETPAMTKRFVNSKLKDINFSPSFASEDAFLTSEDSWEKTRAFVTHSYLSDNGLRQSDRLAMAHSIEPRTPFADSRIYGWAQKNSKKDRKSFDKQEFRAVIELGVNQIVRDKKKQGFSSPYSEWFKDEEVNDLVRIAAIEIEKHNLGWLNRISVKKLNTQEKYRVLMLGLWLKQI